MPLNIHNTTEATGILSSLFSQAKYPENSSNTEVWDVDFQLTISYIFLFLKPGCEDWNRPIL